MTKTLLGALLLASIILLVSVAIGLPTARALSSGACPRVELGETAADCPYAAISRELDELRVLNHQTIDTALSVSEPSLHERIQEESVKAAAGLSLWGKSLNFDEGVKATIIRNEVIDYLLHAFEVSPREGRIVHAGVEHTYGYLFSNLRTSFGYKRARWVADDFNEGFRLTPGTLSPKSPVGGFFANVTYFAGRIAFREEPVASGRLEALEDVATELKSFDYGKLNVRRLEETIREGERTVVIRTDFVEFPGKKGANSEALIYSIVDSSEDIPTSSEVGAPTVSQPKLITMFPVAADFAARALDPKGLGTNRPITTRYNAFVSGITDSPSPLTGTRCVIEQGANRNTALEKRCH